MEKVCLAKPWSEIEVCLALGAADEHSDQLQRFADHRNLSCGSFEKAVSAFDVGFNNALQVFSHFVTGKHLLFAAAEVEAGLDAPAQSEINREPCQE